MGVLFLVASKILEMKDLALIAGQVGLYSATVLAGVLIHGFVVLPLLYFLLVRKNPYSFLLRMGQAMATAFGTSSRYVSILISFRNMLFNTLHVYYCPVSALLLQILISLLIIHILIPLLIIHILTLLIINDQSLTFLFINP